MDAYDRQQKMKEFIVKDESSDSQSDYDPASDESFLLSQDHIIDTYTKSECR